MKQQNDVKWQGYKLSVLAAAHELSYSWDQPSMASDLIKNLLRGENVPALERLATSEGMRIKQWPSKKKSRLCRDCGAKSCIKGVYCK